MTFEQWLDEQIYTWEKATPRVALQNILRAAYREGVWLGGRALAEDEREVTPAETSESSTADAFRQWYDDEGKACAFAQFRNSGCLNVYRLMQLAWQAGDDWRGRGGAFPPSDEEAKEMARYQAQYLRELQARED